MSEVAALIGMSERSARDWIKRHDLPLNDGRPLRVDERAVRDQLAREHRSPRRVPEVPGEAPGGNPEVPGGDEPIEAAYRVTGEAAAGVALVPLATMVEELRGLADQLNDMARRNEALAMEVGQLRERQAEQQSQLLVKDEVITELRRRAEVVEAEAQRLQGEDAYKRQSTPTEAVPRRSWWARLFERG